jgi:hypothetical protein
LLRPDPQTLTRKAMGATFESITSKFAVKNGPDMIYSEGGISDIYFYDPENTQNDNAVSAYATNIHLITSVGEDNNES